MGRSGEMGIEEWLSRGKDSCSPASKRVGKEDR
jgi:hypothetical protein